MARAEQLIDGSKEKARVIEVSQQIAQDAKHDRQKAFARGVKDFTDLEWLLASLVEGWATARVL